MPTRLSDIVIRLVILSLINPAKERGTRKLFGMPSSLFRWKKEGNMLFGMPVGASLYSYCYIAKGEDRHLLDDGDPSTSQSSTGSGHCST